MRLISKTPTNHFWVENFTQEDREFFESIGFKFVKARGPLSFGFCDTLEFRGSGLIGWTNKECDKIFMAVRNYWGKFEVEKYYPN
jgi:hypothetical protein